MMLETIQLNVLHRIELMKDGVPNKSVIKRMNDDGYRRKILLQMLDQRFAVGELDPKKIDLVTLDAEILARLKRDFLLDKPGSADTNIYALYIDLCYNQSLLSKALEAIASKPLTVA